jgi:hypothetical protein
MPLGAKTYPVMVVSGEPLGQETCCMQRPVQDCAEAWAVSPSAKRGIAKKDRIVLKPQESEPSLSPRERGRLPESHYFVWCSERRVVWVDVDSRDEGYDRPSNPTGEKRLCIDTSRRLTREVSAVRLDVTTLAMGFASDARLSGRS